MFNEVTDLRKQILEKLGKKEEDLPKEKAVTSPVKPENS